MDTRNMIRWAAPAAIAAVAIGAAVWVVMDEAGQPGAPIPVMPETVDIERGAALYATSCAACHGSNLEGQPDWQSPGADGALPAPPHDETGHTWHHSDRVLFEYTLLGGREALARQGMEFDSGMPPFGGVLTEQEIWDILAYIQSTWPDRIRETQAQRTLAEQAQGDS